MKSFLHQLLKGVSYCHETHILHRDIKPQNLLINLESLELKIADFGLARAFTVPTRTYSNEVVTLWYRPPDVLLGSNNYTTSIDMWSIGCVFAEMATGKPLFPGHSVSDQLLKIFRLLGTPNTDNYPDIVNLPDWNPDFPVYRGKNIMNIVPGLTQPGYEILMGLLQYDPDRRITAKEALNHTYLADMITGQANTTS